MHKSTVWPFTMRHVRFGLPSADLYAVSLQANRTPCSAVSEQCFGIERIFTIQSFRYCLYYIYLQKLYCFMYRKCFVFVVTPHISGRYNTIVKAPKLFYRNPSCRSRRKPHRRLLFRFVRFAAENSVKKRTVLLRAVLKTTCFVNVKESD